MNDDEIAAVIAAAMIVQMRRVRPAAPPAPARWARSARLGISSPADSWIVASRASNWKVAGRRDD